MVLFLQSKNRICYIPENESEQPVLGWNASLCNFITGYGCEHIGLTFNYNSKYNGYVFCVISVLLNNYLFFCKNSSRSFRWYYVKWWHCYFITLFKYDFLYLDYNILNNHLLEVQKSSDSNTHSTYESVEYSSEVTSYYLNF